MRAETIELVQESEGYELHIVDDEGETFVFNVHGSRVLDQLVTIGKDISDYYAEGRESAREHERELAARAEDERDLLDAEEFGRGLGEIDGGGA